MPAPDDEDVVGIGLGKLETGLPVRRMLGNVARLLEGPLEESRGLLIILDHQNAHIGGPP